MMHIPVLQREVIKYLDLEPDENFVDCTIGQGGHARLILEKTSPGGKILGIDSDKEQIKKSRLQLAEFGNRVVLTNDSYSNLKEIIEEKSFKTINGILLDLGVSSEQLENSGRGFSFSKNEPLDMRYTGKMPNAKYQMPNDLTAGRIVNEWPEKEIEKILREYGEEKFAGRISRDIAKARKIKPIKTTFELVKIIEKAVPGKFRHGRIHCATKTFQAIRIAVNDELNNLKKVLPQAMDVLEKGGRIAVISFHSIEDRIAKNFLKDSSGNGIAEILTKKPITPGREEVAENPRSRSAKLRAAVKI